MANAMLKEDFKTSHPDLLQCAYNNHNSNEHEDAQHNAFYNNNPTVDHRQHLSLQQQQQQHHHHHHRHNNSNDEQRDQQDSPSHSNHPHHHQYPQSSVLRKQSYTNTTTSPSMPARTKSVDFAILPPPNKRSRTNSCSSPSSSGCTKWTAKHVVDAISTSIAPKERLEAIFKTKEAFDHCNEEGHNEEIAAGADAALAKHMTFLVWHVSRLEQSRKRDETAHYCRTAAAELESFLLELSSTLEAMESMYRASSHIVEASFQRMGTEVLHLMVTVLQDEMQRRFIPSIATATDNVASETSGHTTPVPRPLQQDSRIMVKTEDCNAEDNVDPEQQQQHRDGKAEASTRYGKAHQRRPITPPLQPLHNNTSLRQHQLQLTPGSPEGDIILRKATKIMGHFARVGSATKPLAHFPGLLTNLIQIISLQPYDCVPWEGRLSALWTIANLACNSENMIMMVCMPGLLTSLVQVACRPLHPGDPLERTMEILRSRSIASRAIVNLSFAPENKIVLADHTALIELLAELVVHRTAPLNRSRTVQDILVTTRRHAVGALRNLAAAPRRTKIRLCEYRNGHLLDVLTDAALNDSDAVVKHRCFATIHNLAIQDTAEKIVCHPALILALKDVLMSEEDLDAGVENEDGTSKGHASATLMVLERTITPSMKSSYESLRDLLDALKPPHTSTMNHMDSHEQNNNNANQDGARDNRNEEEPNSFESENETLQTEEV